CASPTAQATWFAYW
nr:immunoglobulin heavy chain junction region [Mus musculus]